MQFCFSNLKFPLLFSIPQKTNQIDTVDLTPTAKRIGNQRSKYCKSETKLQSDQKSFTLALGGHSTNRKLLSTQTPYFKTKAN